MKIELLCFTAKGLALAGRMQTLLRAAGHAAQLRRSGQKGLTAEGWTERFFAAADALVFVGAAGIAVRSIAPHLQHKTTDPAVLVADEAGRYIVPILAGHIGGGNALARQLATALGAQAVITTATDVQGVFAVDVWAVGQGLALQNPKAIQRVSAALLAGQRVGIKSVLPLGGPLPNGLYKTDDAAQAGIVVDVAPCENAAALLLVPRALALGAGCKKGVPQSDITAAFERFCAENRLYPGAFYGAYSIDLKKHEPGLAAFCQGQGLPFETFTAAQLAALPGSFTPSAFVQKTTGVNNVCERAAALGSGGALVAKKWTQNGVALAAALRPQILWFGEDR